MATSNIREHRFLEALMGYCHGAQDQSESVVHWCMGGRDRATLVLIQDAQCCNFSDGRSSIARILLFGCLTLMDMPQVQHGPGLAGPTLRPECCRTLGQMATHCLVRLSDVGVGMHARVRSV